MKDKQVMHWTLGCLHVITEGICSLSTTVVSQSNDSDQITTANVSWMRMCGHLEGPLLENLH
jgi:hypothetical protein